MHDPGTTVVDLAVAIVLSGDCLAGAAAALRAQPDVFGPGGSRSPGSRLIDALTGDVEQVAPIHMSTSHRTHILSFDIAKPSGQATAEHNQRGWWG